MPRIRQEKPALRMPLFWRVGIIAAIAVVALAYLVKSAVLCIIAFMVLYGIYAMFPVLEDLFRRGRARK